MSGHSTVRPGLAGTALPALAAAVTVLAVAAVPVAAAAALVGLVVLSAGVGFGVRRIHAVGALTLFGAVLVAGVVGAAVPLVLAGIAAAIVAWDAGEHAIGLGEQVRHGARASAYLVHVGGTATAVGAVAVGAFAVYRVVETGRPTLAVLLLLVAAVLFAWVLDSY